jgi:cytochrome c1
MPELSRFKWFIGVAVLVGIALAVASGYAVFAKRQELQARVAALTGGDPVNGRDLAHSKGCNGCHDIPGTDGPRGNVGAPLTRFASRVYIAGVLLNTPDNLRQWLLDPPRIEPKTAMPNVGLSDREARDLSAFLYTLN